MFGDIFKQAPYSTGELESWYLICFFKLHVRFLYILTVIFLQVLSKAVKVHVQSKGIVIEYDEEIHKAKIFGKTRQDKIRNSFFDFV